MDNLLLQFWCLRTVHLQKIYILLFDLKLTEFLEFCWCFAKVRECLWIWLWCRSCVDHKWLPDIKLCRQFLIYFICSNNHTELIMGWSLQTVSDNMPVSTHFIHYQNASFCMSPHINQAALGFSHDGLATKRDRESDVGLCIVKVKKARSWRKSGWWMGEIIFGQWYRRPQIYFPWVI